MKELVSAAKAATRRGVKLDDAIRWVYQAMVEESLVMTRGNQTMSAEHLHCNRQTVRKYTLTKQDKPMVGRWCEHNGEQPIRKSKIEVEYFDGSSIVTYAHHVCWMDAPIKRWRPYYS